MKTVLNRQAENAKQKCLDRAMRFLARRPHSRRQLQQKLRRHWSAAVVVEVLRELQRLAYVDDGRFARAMACASVEKHHGRQRAMVDLMRSGVANDLAQQALQEAYGGEDQRQMARELAAKHARRLRRLDPQTARRRLMGVLQRRGFDYETVRPILDELWRGGDFDP